jgi:fructose-bisphosphate aldolase class II
MKEKSAVLDLGLIGKIAAEVSVPLVLHGSSGVSVDQIGQAVKAGIRKVNIATEFNVVLTQSIKDYLVENDSVVDPRKYIGAARVKMQELAQMYLERI